MIDILLLFAKTLAISAGIGIGVLIVFGGILLAARLGVEKAEEQEHKHVIKWEDQEKG